MVVAVEGRERSEEKREWSLTCSLDFCLLVIVEKEKSDLEAWKLGCGPSSGKKTFKVAVRGDRALWLRTGAVTERRETDRRKPAATPARSPLVTEELCL